MKRTLAVLMCLLPVVAAAQSPNDAGKRPAATFRGFGGDRPAAVVGGTGSFSGSESTMSPRFYRSGEAGTACSTYSSGDYQYKTVAFTTDASGLLTVSFDPGTCATSIYSTFHTVPFNPASICTGHVWSNGSSVAYSQPFAVPPNTPMVMVVSGVSTAPGVVCGPYTYAIDGTASGVPTMSEWAMIVMAVLLGAAGIYSLRRRRRSKSE